MHPKKLDTTKGLHIKPFLHLNWRVEPVATEAGNAMKPHKELHGYGGKMGTLAFCVPQDSDWMGFGRLVKNAEETFCTNALQYASGKMNTL